MAHSLEHESYKTQVSAVWKATLWLTIITIVEVVAALVWIWYLYPEGGGPRMLLNSFFILASLLKAFFIVGEFMHVRYEKRALALTILGPTFFLIWFIVAFLWEGSEWQNNRIQWNAQPTEHLNRVIEHGHGHDDHGHDHKKGGDHGHSKDSHKKGGH